MTTTEPESTDLSRTRRARAIRRVLLTILTVFVSLGLAGIWGVRTRTVAAEAEGYRITVEYPTVTRPALAVRWHMTIRSPGGFSGPIRVVSSSAYFELFDHNALDPEPASSSTTDDDLVWEFDKPDGDTMTILLDTRVEPGIQRGRTGRSALVVNDRTIAEVEYRTRVMP